MFRICTKSYSQEFMAIVHSHTIDKIDIKIIYLTQLIFTDHTD